VTLNDLRTESFLIASFLFDVLFSKQAQLIKVTNDCDALLTLRAGHTPRQLCVAISCEYALRDLYATLCAAVLHDLCGGRDHSGDNIMQ
jgi:hypothetical protein